MIGERLPMRDAEDRVTGRIRYTQDFQVPGMLHAAVHRSQEPHARIVEVNVSQAQAMPGVVAVLTGADLAKLPLRPRYGPVFRDQPVLAIDRVRYVGEPVAAVAAVDARTARAAAEAIQVSYHPLPAVYDIQQALAPDAPLVPAQLEHAPGFADIIVQGQSGNVCNRFVLRKGEGLDGFADADEIFEHEFRTPPVQHVAMEPHGALARFESGGLTVVTGTQTPYAVRDTLAHMFDLPASRVRIIVPPIGGGFGGKTYAKAEPVAATLALATRRPVKFVLTREEEFVSTTKHESAITLRTGVKRDGTLVARQTRALFNAGAYTDISPRLIKNGGYATAGPYRIPHVDVESLAVFTNLPPAGAFRGYGVAQAAWAYESHMDMIASELGLDPVEFRMRNLLRDGEPFATGEPVHGARFAEVLGDALQLFDAPADRADPTGAGVASDDPAASPPGASAQGERAAKGTAGPAGFAGSGEIRRGRGCAVIIKSTITPSTSNALVKLNADGSLQVLTSTVEMGQGAHTALSQIAASALGVPVPTVSVMGPDTDATPYDLTTSSSRSTAAMGSAVRSAVVDLRRQLLDAAAEQLEIDPADLELEHGVIRVVGDPQVKRTIAEVVGASRRGTFTAAGDFISAGGLDPETGQGIASDHWHQGAAAVEVEVDTGTGKVRVRKLRASVFAGTVINPVNARMQIEGSCLFGLSQALFEEQVYEDGHVANPNLSEYALPVLGDLPEVFEVSLLEDPDSDEVHGLGETALPVIAPAVANAVADAIGVRLRRIPLLPERVLQAMEDGDG